MALEREVLSIEISMKLSYGPVPIFHDGIILLLWTQLQTGYLTYYNPAHPPKLRDESVCKMYCRQVNGGQFKIGSLENSFA